MYELRKCQADFRLQQGENTSVSNVVHDVKENLFFEGFEASPTFASAECSIWGKDECASTSDRGKLI